MSTCDLFDALPVEPTLQLLAPGAVLLRAFASQVDGVLLQALAEVVAQAPFRTG